MFNVRLGGHSTTMTEGSTMSLKYVILAPLIAVLGGSVSTLAQTAITLDHVDGSFTPGTITTQGPVTFYLRMTNFNEWQTELRGATNGFRIYSPNHARWSPPEAFEVIDMGEYFDMINLINYYSADGMGIDTIAVALVRATGPGLPHGFDSVTHGITINVDPAYEGRTICLDSTTYDIPNGMWLWTYGAEYGSLQPEWGGPYCFTVDNSPCCQVRGNIDHDPDGQIAVNDLVYLAAYMFQSGPPPVCLEEANIDGDPAGQIAINDLVWLAAYMFNEGPPPVPCE
jgi:hypothetical protein